MSKSVRTIRLRNVTIGMLEVRRFGAEEIGRFGYG